MDFSPISNYSPFDYQDALAAAQDRARAIGDALGSGSDVSDLDSANISIASALQAEQMSDTAAQENIDDSTSLLQTADAGLGEASNILAQMQTLATTAANTGLTPADRGYLDQSFQSLGAQLQSVAGGTQYNGQSLLDGSMGPATLQVNAMAGAAGQQALNLPTVTPTALGLGSASLSTAQGAREALTALSGASGVLGVAQASVGAQESALGYDDDALGVAQVSAAQTASNLGDTNYIATTALNAQNQIMQGFQVALAAQANIAPRSLLELLDGPET